MLTYSFTDIVSDSLYIHLYKCIKNDILQGILTTGNKLPSKRTFAKNLGISIITVENAYSQLIAEGYIYSVSKKGFYVADVAKTAVEKAATTESIQFTEESHQYLIDFSGNQTDIDSFPFSVWSRIVREILNDNQKDLLTIPPCGGLMELRESISLYLHQFRNMNVSKEQIIIGAGTEYLYSLLVQLLGHDKLYAVENPGYHKIKQIYDRNQVSCKMITVDKNGLCLNELEEKAPDIVHISPAHHFPTGIVMPISQRYELLAWAARSEKRYIIEDEYDSEFRLSGQPIPTLQSIDVCQKVIYMNTFTKSLASTVRISYMVLPPHLVNLFYKELSFYSCTVSNFEQYTLSRFISEGFFEKHINRMRKLYHQKRDLLLNAIKKSPLSSSATVLEEDAGLHFLLKIDTDYSDTEFCKRALMNGVRISALSSYYSAFDDSNVIIPEHIFIINYSNIKNTVIDEAIQRLFACL